MDLDILGFLKMSKIKNYKKSFGNACFLGLLTESITISKKFGPKTPY
jgi:hypothetical protein